MCSRVEGTLKDLSRGGRIKERLVNAKSVNTFSSLNQLFEDIEDLLKVMTIIKNYRYTHAMHIKHLMNWISNPDTDPGLASVTGNDSDRALVKMCEALDSFEVGDK